MDKTHIVVLTGAGVSAESGLKTFRDTDGLWMGHEIEDVATPAGFSRNPARVLAFYNMRRREVAAALPNAAHKGLAELERDFKVSIITQNIDDLHERAGSTAVLHLHGEIFKMYSLGTPHEILEVRGDIFPGDKGRDGTQLRPHVVWFGEEVPMIEIAINLLHQADVFVIIGTSLQVYPAAALLQYSPANLPKYMIDTRIPSLPEGGNLHTIEMPASSGVAELTKLLSCKY